MADSMPLAVLIISAVFILTMMLKICKEAYWPPPRLRSEDLPVPAFDSSGRPLTIYKTYEEAREFAKTGRVVRHEIMAAAGRATAQVTAVDKVVVLAELATLV